MTPRRFWLLALMALAAVPAAAHHRVATYYDASKPGSVTGTIVELRVVNPHVVLIVDGTAPDGRTGRWAFEGNPPNVFQRQGFKDFREKLTPGTPVTIFGWPAKDPSARAFSGGEVMFADGSTNTFGSPPGESDRWKCRADPCPYTYPAVN